MQISTYALDSNVRQYPALTEISKRESRMLQKAYRGERIFKGPEFIMHGEPWAIYVSALSDGQIFKIAAQFMSDEPYSIDEAYAATFADYARQFGQPEQVTPSGAHRWNQPFGNVILGKVSGPGLYAINLIATSDNRPASRLDKQGCLAAIALFVVRLRML
jgi:hypothetical protein